MKRVLAVAALVALLAACSTQEAKSPRDVVPPTAAAPAPSCSPSDVQLATILTTNGAGIMALQDDRTLEGYRTYIQVNATLSEELRTGAAQAPADSQDLWTNAIEGFEKIRLGYAQSITSPSGPKQDAAYARVLEGQQLQALAYNDLDARGCTKLVPDSAASPPAASGLPPSSAQGQKTFAHAGIALLYPATWTLEVTSEGAGVANGCSAGFWAARASLPEGGIAGVTRCPSSFDWPPSGETASEALRRELAMRDYADEFTSVRSLAPDEMGGLEGIRVETELDVKAAAQFGISGPSRGAIYRAVSLASDPAKPDIFEVFCQVPVNDAAQALRDCALIVDSFHLT